MNHVGTAASAVPRSEARRSATTLAQKHKCRGQIHGQPVHRQSRISLRDGTNRNTHAQRASDHCLEAYREPERESMAGHPRSPSLQQRYALVPIGSPADAGTARVRAHSRNAAISSARVVESGTVCASASSSDCVVSAFFSEYAA